VPLSPAAGDVLGTKVAVATPEDLLLMILMNEGA
jgi:hypothetical protein